MRQDVNVFDIFLKFNRPLIFLCMDDLCGVSVSAVSSVEFSFGGWGSVRGGKMWKRENFSELKEISHQEHPNPKWSLLLI